MAKHDDFINESMLSKVIKQLSEDFTSAYPAVTGYGKLTISKFESGKVGGGFDLMLYYIKFLSVDDVKDICTAILWGNENG